MFAQVGTLKEHWTALLACLAASFYFLFVVVRRETNPLPARAPPAGPLGRFADRLRLRSLCYVLALLLPPFAFGVAATLKYPRHYRDRDGTQLYTFVGAGAGSVTADFPNHPGTIDCASLGAEDVTNWYVYAAQQLKGSQLRVRAELPALDPPVLDAWLEQTTTCCDYQLDAANWYEAGRDPQRDLTLAELAAFWPRGAMTADDAARRAQRFYDNGGDGLTLGELASVNHAPALSRLATDDDADAAYVFRLSNEAAVVAAFANVTGGGLSLSTALDAGALYRADFEFLAAVSERGYGADLGVAPGYNCSSPVALLWRDGDALYTVAIEMRSVDADPDSAVDIYTAVEANPVDWLYARLRLRHAAYITQGLYHVVGLHATPVAAFAAAYATLGQDHPVTNVLEELVARAALVACGVEEDARRRLDAVDGESTPRRLQFIAEGASRTVASGFNLNIRGDYTLPSSMLWVTNGPNNLRVESTPTIQALCARFPVLETWNLPKMLAARHLDDDLDDALPGEALPRSSMMKVWDAAHGLASALVAVGGVGSRERHFWDVLADANGANLHPGMLDDDQDFVDVVAVLLFQKLVHSLTRCFQNTAPIFMQKLAMPSTLRDLPPGKPGFASADDLARHMAGSRDTVDDFGVTGAALSFPAQNLWHEDRNPFSNARAEEIYVAFLNDLSDTMARDAHLRLFIPCMEVGADV